jgi:tetratricopeptide (TPR) repeat protein
MIVKNESKIIKRCLDSVKSIVDTYVICDTGSTDDTKDVIKKIFNENSINGIILDHEWVNFGYNRSQLVQVANGKADYLLLVDADYVINIFNKNFKEKLCGNGYYLKWDGNLDYKNLKLINGHLNWKYFGPTHEYIKCIDNEYSKYELLDDISITEYYDGGNRLNKFKRDIQLLLNEISINPLDDDIPRYHFYLGRSYEDIGEYKLAMKHYQKRVDCGGWEEEVYFSMYKIGLCKIQLNYDFGSICETLLKSYNFRPSRLEAIYDLIKYCRCNDLQKVGYILGCGLLNKKYPKDDVLFIKKDIYDYKLKDEISICAFYAGEYKKSIELCEELLKSANVPKSHIPRISKNMKFSTEKIDI